MNRTALQRLYLALLSGVLIVTAIFAGLFFLGTAPLLPPAQAPVIAIAMAAFAVAPMLFGGLWARPQIPLRRRGTSVEDYWRDPVVGGRALLLWVLWEGSAIIGAVGTLLTGSLVTGVAGVLALGLLITHSPRYLEGREGDDGDSSPP
jgi:hypothetical protein